MIGIDIVSIKRFEKFLEKKTALSKYLSDEEIPLVTSPSTAAGFFATKEAVSKALGTGIGEKCSFKDIKIHKDSKGAPFYTLSSHIIEEFDIIETALSISHDGGFAIAVTEIKTKNPLSRPISH